MAEVDLKLGIPRFKANESRINDWVNGDENTDFETSGGVDVPSVRKLTKQKSDEIDTQLVRAYAANVTRATKAQLDAVVGDYPDGAVGMALRDPDVNLRGTYTKVAGAWADREALPTDAANTALAATLVLRDDVEDMHAEVESDRAATITARDVTTGARDVTLAARDVTLTARDAAIAAAEASGDVAFYDTKADADAALASLPEGQIVEVFEDESRNSARTRYKKVTGAFVLKLLLGGATVRPESFGLVGLGDDSAAVQAAVTFAASTGRTVELSGPAYVVKNIAIPTDGARFVSRSGAVLTPAAGATAMFNIAAGASKVLFDGLSFTDPTRVMARTAPIISADDVTDYQIVNCKFFDMQAIPAKLLNTKRGLIAFNRCYDNVFDGPLSDENGCEFRLTENQEDITIIHNSFEGQADILTSKEVAIFALAITPGKFMDNVKILHNTTRNYRRSGIQAGTNEPAELAAPTRRVDICGNTIINSGQEGIKWKGGRGVHCDSNTVDGFELVCHEYPNSLRGGIFMQLTPESTCNGNRVYGRNQKLFEGTPGTVTGTTIELPANDYQALEFDAALAGTNVMIGKMIRITAGTGAGQNREITAYNKTTNVATVAAWTVQPDGTSTVEVWSNPSVGIFFRGNNTGTSDWTDSRVARGFQSFGSYVEDCALGIGLSEPLFQSQFGDIVTYNCGQGLSGFTAGVSAQNCRSVTIRDVDIRYVDYPTNPTGPNGFVLANFINPSLQNIRVHGSRRYGISLTTITDLEWIGGLIEGAGLDSASQYGANFVGVVGAKIVGVTFGGANAGATQLRAAAWTGAASSGMVFVGCDFTGNATEPFNSSSTLDAPADTRFEGCKGAGFAEGVTTLTDAAKAVTPGVDKKTMVLSAPLTANRAVSLPTTRVVAGDEIEIIRTAASTGASNLNVGTGPLKAMATGTWARFKVDDAQAWYLVASGSL